MAGLLRGEVYWADLNPIRGREQAGYRPVIVISSDRFNRRSDTVIALAVTGSQPRAGFPLTHELTSAQLPKRSWAIISQVRTISLERIGRKITQLSAEEVNLLVSGLQRIVTQ